MKSRYRDLAIGWFELSLRSLLYACGGPDDPWFYIACVASKLKEDKIGTDASLVLAMVDDPQGPNFFQDCSKEMKLHEEEIFMGLLQNEPSELSDNSSGDDDDDDDDETLSMG